MSEMTPEKLEAARTKLAEKIENMLSAARAARNTQIWSAMVEVAECLEPAILPLLTRQEARDLTQGTRNLLKAFEGFNDTYTVSMTDMSQLMKDFFGMYTHYLSKLTDVATREITVLDRLDRVLAGME